jgi:hypothetical protein
MPASLHLFTANLIIRHAEPSVKTHPRFGFLTRTAFAVAGLLRQRVTTMPYNPVRWMLGTLASFLPPVATAILNPGNANLLIGGLRDANQEIGVPGRFVPSVSKMPHAAEHHGDVQPVRRRDHVRIANRAARLNHGRGAGLSRFFEAVREGKKGV